MFPTKTQKTQRKIKNFVSFVSLWEIKYRLVKTDKMILAFFFILSFYHPLYIYFLCRCYTNKIDTSRQGRDV